MDLDLSTLGTGYSDIYDKFNRSIFGRLNNMMLIILTFVIIIYYSLFSSFSSKQTMGSGEGTPGLNILELLLWGIFVFLLLINGLQYFLDIDVKASIKNLIEGKPEIDISVLQEKIEEEIKVPEEEVYHIGDNTYTYDDAKAVCKAFGGRLATYNEIEESYNNGGEWCSYGWSKDQLALYPTQKSTYNKLQEKKGLEHSCGRPGINGGYIANEKVRFGVNCYGHKPKMNSDEWKKMSSMNVEPVSKEDKEFQKKVNKYKSKLDEILVSPFNNNKWNEYL